MDLNLNNSTALIVGGASGIGLASARAFRDEGCSVTIWDISSETTQLAASEGCTGCTVDICDIDAIGSAISLMSDGIDHLVHAAAIGSGRFGFPFTNLDPAHWQRVLDVNISGMVNVAHAVTPVMVGAGHGSMVFVASVAGQIGSPTDPPYSASKAANINFAQVMAKDLAACGIRVNTVCPGMVKTPLNRSVWQLRNERQPAAEQLTYDQWAEQKISQLVPLGEWQQPEDIADTIVFLSSERARQITGQTINVDGGYVMHW